MSSENETIIVEQLSKTYKVSEREGGFTAAARSFFKRRYKDVQAVKQVSFRIGQGEIVGFLGPNGAGKTTTLKMLSGLLHPTGGNARVLGYTPWELEFKLPQGDDAGDGPAQPAVLGHPGGRLLPAQPGDLPHPRRPVSEDTQGAGRAARARRRSSKSRSATSRSASG